MSTATAVPAGDAPAGGTSFGTPAYRGYVLIVLTLVYTLNFVDRNLLTVIGQPVTNAFGLSDTEYGFLNGPPFALFYAFMGIPLAMAADRFNRVVIVALCIAIWSLMAALCGFATSFLFLLFARVGVAIGEAGGTPPANSIIGDYYKPRSRANALGIYAMGVTIGGALSNFFGGPIATGLNGAALKKLFDAWGWDWALKMADWDHVEGWRVAFVTIGAPGLLVALLLLLTVKEPPRGYSDPPGAPKVQKANMIETLKELGPKPTFWTMAMGASLVALVGYGLVGFQSQMVIRIHHIDAGTFALRFGGPLALFAAAGTFAGGFLVERLSPKFPTAVSIVPVVGMMLAMPLYIFAYYQPTEHLYSVSLPLWSAGAFCHYMYLGSQYTIGQGVVSQRSRASAIAILLLLIALIGNGLGPQIVGWMSDMFMGMELTSKGFGGVLTTELCRNAGAVAKLAADQQAVCAAAYGEGLRSSMTATALIFMPAALFFFLSSLTLKKDMLAMPS
ncbi:MAG: MFS transporter [Alphaproteobacteria bacterium]|nr:MFS transporter [Alphaproteobacteria bacterium]